jgi:hypothetical protein
MWTYYAERVVPADTDRLNAAIDALVLDRWGDHAYLVAADGGSSRTYGIGQSSTRKDPDVWLTWHIHQLGDVSRLRLTLDEVEPGPDPTATLAALVDQVAVVGSATESR